MALARAPPPPVGGAVFCGAATWSPVPVVVATLFVGDADDPLVDDADDSFVAGVDEPLLTSRVVPCVEAQPSTSATPESTNV